MSSPAGSEILQRFSPPPIRNLVFSIKQTGVPLGGVLAGAGPQPAFRCAEIRQRGPSPVANHFFKTPCAVNAAMLKAEKAYRAELKKVTVADLGRAADPALGKAITTRSCAFFDLHERNRSTTPVKE